MKFSYKLASSEMFSKKRYSSYWQALRTLTCGTGSGKSVNVYITEGFAFTCAMIFKQSTGLIYPLGINNEPKRSNYL